MHYRLTPRSITLNCYNFEFSENFADLGGTENFVDMGGTNSYTNEDSDRIVTN